MRSSSASGALAAASMRATVLREDDDEQRKEQARHDQRCFDAQPRDRGWSDSGTDAHGCHPEHLDHAEDASHNVVGDGALNEGQAGDVDERVPDSHDRERDDGDGDVLPQADGDERNPRDDESDEERRAESPRSGERQRADRSDEGADADRGVEIADARVAEVEQLERSHDDEHLERSEHRRLCGEEAPSSQQGSDLGRAW